MTNELAYVKHPARIIARLDVKGSNVVKGIQMEGLRIVGEPNALARKYYEQGADELIFMDIVASLYGRNQILPVIENAARDIFIPITVGGGIRSVDDITTVLRSGADKVAINTATIADPLILRRAAEAFGSQCIVLSIEAKAQADGGWECYTDNGRERTGRNAEDWAEEAEALGVGEIFVTSVDRDGTRSGFDLPLCHAIRQRVRIPVIAAGGAGESGHVSSLFRETNIDAVCCGVVFHFDACPIPTLKAALHEDGNGVRI
jgi:imidazole glycerol-phosphate synthase subunit HisF